MRTISSAAFPARGNLTPQEIDEAYEKNTGTVIIETFEERGLNPEYTPGVICKNHGPFTWGKDADQAVYHAVVLEEVAKMALLTEQVNPKVEKAPDCIRDKHFFTASTGQMPTTGRIDAAALRRNETGYGEDHPADVTRRAG